MTVFNVPRPLSVGRDVRTRVARKCGVEELRHGERAHHEARLDRLDGPVRLVQRAAQRRVPAARSRRSSRLRRITPVSTSWVGSSRGAPPESSMRIRRRSTSDCTASRVTPGSSSASSSAKLLRFPLRVSRRSSTSSRAAITELTIDLRGATPDRPISGLLLAGACAVDDAPVLAQLGQLEVDGEGNASLTVELDVGLEELARTPLAIELIEAEERSLACGAHDPQHDGSTESTGSTCPCGRSLPCGRSFPCGGNRPRGFSGTRAGPRAGGSGSRG
jgi:hypothetical protein